VSGARPDSSSAENTIEPMRTVSKVTAGGLSCTLVLVVPEHGLPELDLVPVRIHDPRELAVLGRFGSLDDFHAPCTQLIKQFTEVVDPVIDHEGRGARAEPLAVLSRETPDRNA